MITTLPIKKAFLSLSLKQRDSCYCKWRNSFPLWGIYTSGRVMVSVLVHGEYVVMNIESVTHPKTPLHRDSRVIFCVPENVS